MSLHECTLRLTPVYLERTNSRGFSVPVDSETSISRSVPFTISLDVQRARGGPGFESCATDPSQIPTRQRLCYKSRPSSVVCGDLMGMPRRRVRVDGMKARLCSRYGTYIPSPKKTIKQVVFDTTLGMTGRKFRWRGNHLWGMVNRFSGVEHFHFRVCFSLNNSSNYDITSTVGQRSHVCTWGK